MADKVVETMRVLVVSRETALLRPLWSIGESNSWHLETAASGWEAMERVQSGVAPHVLLLDLPRGDGDSLHILRWLRRLHPDLPIVVVCHPEDTGTQKEATRLGAQEVLAPPFDESQLERVILNLHFDSLSEMEIASDDIESVGEDESFLSVGPVMQRLRAQAELLAQADVPVLILGEPGSGKTTVARLIHKLSVHSGFSFQTVNCAMMPGHLIEIELFGRTNNSSGGTATGKSGPGKLDLAQKGTLLLDEITEMPMSLQSRFLQVLQDKQFVRLGENQPVRTVVRILATSSAKLDRALAEKRLREDLYYRLSAFTVHVPPLRQRKDEIRVLLQYFMHKVARYYGLPPREFSPSMLQACVTHFWPGNLKELETFVKRHLVAGDQEFVPAGHESASGTNRYAAQSSPLRLFATPSDVDAATRGTEPRSLKSLIQSVKSETERNAIAAALEKTRWNRKAAARLLRVSYRTLLYKIEHYHMRASDTTVLPFRKEG
jgi:two-component system, NtrC family, response regulator AtoC